MAIDDRYLYSAERDVPIDFSHNPEEGTQFARFYLDRANQNSSIYFVERQEQDLSRAPAQHIEKRMKPEASPLSMLWRLAWLCSAGAAIALAIFVIPRVMPVGQQAQHADYADVYAHVISAQKSVFALAIGDAIVDLDVARAGVFPEEIAPASGAASIIGAARAFITKNVAPASTLDAVLTDVVTRSVASAEPLGDLSFASFFRSDDGAAAGDIIERAFTETKNAEAAIENATQALLVAEENGDAGALRAALGPQLSVMKANLERYAENLTFASWALGVEYPRRFLIVAQDPSLARATGGVVRSLGLVTVQKGAITDISFDEVYSIDGQLQTNVIPPEPIQKVATAWAIHDANWFLDFPVSAQKIAYFYEQAGGKRLDGVIAINDHMLKNMLAVTGPVAGKDDVLVNAESGNIAGDPAAVSAIFTVLGTLREEKATDAMRVITDGLAEKDILVWVSDRDHEEMVRAKGWSGAIEGRDDADYLAIVASDIEGKGDAGTTGEILKETTVDEHGVITNTVVVEFAGQADANDKKLRYLRVYVPLGSELLEVSESMAQKIVPQIDYAKEHFIADGDLAVSVNTREHSEEYGIDIFQESGKTVFGMWMPMHEKNTRVVLRYTAPFLMSGAGAFTAIFQKQPGMDMGLHFSVIAPEGQTISSPDDFDGEFHGSLAADTLFTMTIQ